MRWIPTILLIALCGGGCHDQPDVVVLFLDTLRHDRLGCTEAVGAMPTVEQYTLDGACFDRAASTAGWTLPSETSMLLSTYPEEHGITRQSSHLEGSYDSITTPLVEADYQTALFSGNVLSSHPHFHLLFEEMWVVDREDEFAANVDELVVGHAEQWMEEDLKRGKPAFIVLQLFGPHLPYCAPGTDDGVVEVPEIDEGSIDLCDPAATELLHAAEAVDPFPPALAARMAELYDQEVTATDEQVSRFLTSWDAARGSRERLTVVMTDHGESFGEHGRVLHGRSLHRETSDCHLAFHGTGIERQAVDRPVELLDLAPTVISLLEMEAPSAWRGADLTPLFTEPGKAYDARVYQSSELLGTWQYGATLEGDDGHRYRLLTDEASAENWLYDATADPEESTNLYDDPQATEMQQRLEQFLDEMKATAAAGGPTRTLP